MAEPATTLLASHSSIGYLLAMTKPTHPNAWREQAEIPLASLARTMGVSGRNPSRTVQRWLTGQRPAPAYAIAVLETLSCGVVKAAGWADVRRQHVTRKNTERPALNGEIRSRVPAC